MCGRQVWMLLAMLPLLPASSSVSVDPSNPVAFVGSKNYTLRCILVTASTDISRLLGVTWLLNGTILESLDLVDVSPDFDTIGTGIGILTFANLLSEYNYTTIQCRGHQESGRNDTSESVVLRLQGTLSAVSNLNIGFLNSMTSLSWMAPFSLITLGITYTVGVVGLASSSMQDGVTSLTEFTHPFPPGSGCDNLIFTVTPHNEAGEGIPNSIPLSQAIEPPQLMEVLSPTLAPRTRTGVVRDTLTYHISMSSPVCSAEVTLTDKNTGEVITFGNTDLNFSSTLMDIAFTNERLALNQQYGFTVNASNINGSAISSGDISTYDVVNSRVHTDPLRVHTEYSPNSNASGVLYGFFYIGESGVDFSRSAYFALSRNYSLSYELPSPLPAGVYIVHTYVIGQDGLLSSGEAFPATTDVFYGNGGSQISISPPSSSEIEDCDISSTDLMVSVLCVFSPTSFSTGFLLVVQKKSARGLLVNTTEQGEPQEPVTVQLEVGGKYQVTVFPISEGMGILESDVAYAVEITVDAANNPTPGTTRSGSTPLPPVSDPDILSIIIGVGTGLGILALLAIVLGVVILVVVCCRSRGSIRLNIMSEEKAEAHVEPSGKGEAIALAVGGPSLIYEEIGDPKSSFTYSQNILYGQSTTTVTHLPTSDPLPDVPTDERLLEPHIQKAQAIDNVKKSFSYTRNIVHGLSITGATSDSVPKVCTGLEPSDQETKTDDYVLMQTAEHQSLGNAFKLHHCSAYAITSSADQEEKTGNYVSKQTTESEDAFKVQQCSAYGIAPLAVWSCDPSMSCDTCRSCDPSTKCKGANALSEKSCDPDDPVEVSSNESCDLEECPAYGVPPLGVGV